MKFWIFIRILFRNSNNYRNSVSNELYTLCRFGNGKRWAHYARYRLWLIDALYPREWGFNVFHNGLYSHCERFILRFLHVTERVTVMCRCSYLHFNDGNGFYGLTNFWPLVAFEARSLVAKIAKPLHVYCGWNGQKQMPKMDSWAWHNPQRKNTYSTCFQQLNFWTIAETAKFPPQPQHIRATRTKKNLVLCAKTHKLLGSFTSLKDASKHFDLHKPSIKQHHIACCPEQKTYIPHSTSALSADWNGECGIRKLGICVQVVDDSAKNAEQKPENL